MTKASDRIEQALSVSMAEFDDFEEGDIITEWITVVCMTNPNTGRTAAYPMFFSSGAMPVHVARGLLHTGLKHLDQDDDDD